MVAKRRERAHLSSYRLLMAHLLKWKIQPERRTASWAATIRRERSNIREREQRSKGYRLLSAEHQDLVYALAVKDAMLETGLSFDVFPELCPFSLDFLHTEDAMPEDDE